MEILLSTKEIKDILKKHCEEHFCEKPFMLIKDE